MNKKYIKFIIFTLLILCMIFVAILPIKKINTLKSEITTIRQNQVKLLNDNLKLIPELINISKGYLINDKNALKNIIKINILATEQTKSFDETYKNQSKLLSLTMELLDDAKKNSPLTTNQKFIDISNTLTSINTKIITDNIICVEKSNKLKKLLKLPLYDNFVNKEEINKILCTENFSDLKQNFNF